MTDSPARDDRSAEGPPPGRPLAIRVLVVDDDEVDRERVRRTMLKTGIETAIVEADDPTAAIAILQRTPFDLVVLDYEFPLQDGIVVLRELHEMDAVLPVIVLTGRDEMTLAVELMKAGAVDYISKQALTPERLAQSVRHAIRLRASELATRAAHEALRASEEFNRHLLDSSDDAIQVLDLHARVISANQGGRRLLDLPSSAPAGGLAWLDLWTEDHQQSAATAVAEARGGRVGRFVGSRINTSGAAVWWDVVITPITRADGRPDRLLLIGRDVTDQKRQAEFEQQLIGIVSHDLRNPVSAMVMGATLVRQMAPPDSQLATIAGRIANSGERARRLIHDLLDFTQVRLAGALPVERLPADMHVICRQVIDELALDNAAREIEHEAIGNGEGLWDSDRVAQLIANLARNALSYSPRETKVTLRSFGLDELVRVEVHNDGTPIPAQLIPHLFQPFKRGERKHDPDRSIGLGLFIVREIATAHDGHVSVESSATEGTTFRLDLPRWPNGRAGVESSRPQ